MDYFPATGGDRNQKSNKCRQELTSRNYLLNHRLWLFDAVITPTINYVSGTWTLTKEHERMIQSTQRRMLQAYEHYTQESSVEQRSPNDFDYDDVTIGKALSDACRRRADHSEEEGLSSCLSSSVSHDRRGRPVVCTLDSQVSSVQETRHSSESEQIGILLERQREQILADCQADKIRKHEFQGRS